MDEAPAPTPRRAVVNRINAYLDTVVRLDGAMGFIVAPHPELHIWCVKWPDEADPRWASPDLIREWVPGSGIDREMLLLERGRIEEQLARERLGYDPLDYIH